MNQQNLCYCIEQNRLFKCGRDKVKKRDQRLEEVVQLNIDSIKYKGCTITVRKNDITTEPTDAVVNPANEKLTNGAGAAGAIKNAAGSSYTEACIEYLKKHETLSTGEAALETAGLMPSYYIINTVGPRCETDQEDIKQESKMLRKVVENVLNLMIKENLSSVSLLAISTGLFNFPLDHCIKIYAKTIKKFIAKNKREMKHKEIVLCKFIIFICIGNNDDPTVDAMLEGTS